MYKNVLAISAACVFVLAGCSSSSSNDDNDNQTDPSSGEGENQGGPVVLTGVFVDSAVEGVSYSTATQSGVTNSAGEFSYVEGEQVAFSIGAVQFPIVDAAPQVSPVDMGSVSNSLIDTTTNIARLLQSLDTDGNPDNGITISPEAATSTDLIDFSVSTEQFANEPAVINLVANSGSVNNTLISADDAIGHLNETLGIQLAVGEEIVVDLRDSEWIFTNPSVACDGVSNQTILRYSRTTLTGENNNARVQDDGSCLRNITPFERAINDLSGTGFLFLCGGDALCTFDEINQSVMLPVDEPRNDCVDSDGQAQVADRSISHVPGSNVFSYGHCNSSEFIGEYIRQ